MGLNKRGAIFTLFALLLVGFLLVIVTNQFDSQLFDSTPAFTLRVSSINSLVENIEFDLEIATYTVGFRSILALLTHIESTGEYIDDYQIRLTELMMNGTIYEMPSALVFGNTLVDWDENIHEYFQALGIDGNFTYEITNIYQSSPFAVNFAVQLDFNFSDALTSTSWNNSFYTVAQVPIIGFLDPLYIVETQNTFVSRINKTPFTTFTISQLQEHIEQGYYLPSTSAPSFLQRLIGDVGPSPFGIESIVNIDELGLVFPITSDYSHIDYIYFTQQPFPTFPIPGLNPAFRLDNQTTNGVGRLDIYIQP